MNNYITSYIIYILLNLITYVIVTQSAKGLSLPQETDASDVFLEKNLIFFLLPGKKFLFSIHVAQAQS